MNKLIIALPGNETLARALSDKTSIPIGQCEFRRFPDSEVYVRILGEVNGRIVYLVCTLHHPDEQLLALYFLATAAKKAGAARIVLIAPYLSYMRQDKVFQPGEVVTSALFASLLSSFIDELVTIDPHLHRYLSLSEIYSVPCQVKHSMELVARWIATNVQKPLIIGPDSEGRQWVADLAGKLDAPFLVSEKKRHGDRQVEIELPDIEKYAGCHPVLLDDIVSTGKTMMETVRHLAVRGLRAPVCIAVHAVFAPGAYEELTRSGAGQVVSCNTIPHPSNSIDISGLLAGALQ
jgi:ribose-phosphate pyrophosphokinase